MFGYPVLDSSLNTSRFGGEKAFSNRQYRPRIAKPCLRHFESGDKHLYLFNKTIIPILNYASEIWSFEEYATLERLHLSACKYILGVKSTTCTDAVYAEVGRISLQSIRQV